MPQLVNIMDYNDICEKVMGCDTKIKDVYIVNNEAHLLAFNGAGEMDKISEAQLAEILEDLLFIIGSRKHHENVFGRLEYVHIKHKDAETIVFPFEKDKVLCICMKDHSFNETEIVSKLKQKMLGLYRYA